MSKSGRTYKYRGKSARFVRPLDPITTEPTPVVKEVPFGKALRSAAYTGSAHFLQGCAIATILFAAILVVAGLLLT